MLINEKGVRMTPFESALLSDYDGKIALVLVNGDRQGCCELTEAFICALYAKIWCMPSESTLVSKIVSCSDFVTPKLLDILFATRNEEQVSLYLQYSRGFAMESRHVIQLIELGNQELIDLYFRRNATIVLQDAWFEPVVDYLKETNLYQTYRKKYMPTRKFGRA